MRISLIAAVAQNYAIGKDMDLLWHLPNDLKFFKNTTLHHHVVMGRKTFESFGKPLPRRTNIIISSRDELPYEGIKHVKSLDEAIGLCREEGATECFIAGGQKVYKDALPIADRLIITEVHEHFEADTFFPEFDKSQWKEVSREDHKADDKNPYDYSFVFYERA